MTRPLMIFEGDDKCSSKNRSHQKPIINFGRLAVSLSKNGFTEITPASKTWCRGFLSHSSSDELCILFRKGGIDFCLQEDPISVQQCGDRFSAKGKEIIRVTFSESSDSVIILAARVGKMFSEGGESLSVIKTIIMDWTKQQKISQSAKSQLG